MIRDLLGPKISHNSTNTHQKNHPNREFQQLVLTISHQNNEKELHKAQEQEEIDW
jgi:hypothetical protein